MSRSLAAFAISGLVVVSAAAQTTYYVVQDTTTKRCSIVKERSATATMVNAGDSGKVYATEDEALGAIRTIRVCETK